MKASVKVGLPMAGAMLFLSVATSSAQAASYSGSCSTTGAWGSYAVSGYEYGKAGIPDITLKAKDTLADGHHVAVRFVTAYADTETTWPWHHNYSGEGWTAVWDTSISGGGQIYGVRVQVGRFEGDSLLNYCSSSWAP